LLFLGLVSLGPRPLGVELGQDERMGLDIYVGSLTRYFARD
jgi:hypothetical protein